MAAESAPFRVLLKSGEDVTVEYDVPESVAAPVEEGETLGKIVYRLEGETIREYPVTAAESVRERDFSICFSYTRSRFFLNGQNRM